MSLLAEDEPDEGGGRVDDRVAAFLRDPNESLRCEPAVAEPVFGRVLACRQVDQLEPLPFSADRQPAFLEQSEDGEVNVLGSGRVGDLLLDGAQLRDARFAGEARLLGEERFDERDSVLREDHRVVDDLDDPACGEVLDVGHDVARQRALVRGTRHLVSAGLDDRFDLETRVPAVGAVRGHSDDSREDLGLALVPDSSVPHGRDEVVVTDGPRGFIGSFFIVVRPFGCSASHFRSR